MSTRRPRRPARPVPSDGAIDAQYGLEPVFEPGRSEAAGAHEAPLVQLEVIQCPYCGEGVQMLVDLSVGAASYVEDCQVCCQPIDVSVEVNPAGAFSRLAVRRTD
ncbi:MAG TPA: CPXCG motif-containing cysteine-rich protein [Steroidobacteraceae bacterium]